MVALKGNPSTAFTVNRRVLKPWILDSRASDHMTGDATIFQEYNTCNKSHTVRIADGSLSKVEGTGSLGIRLFILNKVNLVVCYKMFQFSFIS